MMPNHSRLDTAEASSHNIQEYCEAMEEFNREAKECTGFASPVVGAGEKKREKVWKKHKGLGSRLARSKERIFGG